jgi:hypothetical protein
METLSFSPMTNSRMVSLVANCAPAEALYRQGLAANFGNSFDIANQFHMHGWFEEAARFYRRSFDQYPVGSGYHPLQKNLPLLRIGWVGAFPVSDIPMFG